MVFFLWLRNRCFAFLFLLLCWQTPFLGGFVIKKEMINSKGPCPATLSIENVAYAADINVELLCPCQQDKRTPVFWFYKETLNSEKPKLLTRVGKDTDEKFLHVESKITTTYSNIILHKAQVEDSGLYLCGSQDGQFYWGYDVDIQDAKNAYVAFKEQHQRPQPNLVTEQFTAFTAFQEWSQCDRCDVPGEQRKVGLCYVSSSFLDPRYKLTENGIASCWSGAVPPNLKEQISGRRPEIFFRNCQATCHKRKAGILGTLKYWWHKLGKIKDYLPWLLKVPIEKHTHTLGSSLTLACPGAKPQDAVAWDKGSRKLLKSDYFIGQPKARRIYIDYGNNLNFRYVSFSDKAIYHCWVQGQLKAGIQLVITTHPTRQRKLSDPVSILAMKIIGCSFAVFTLIFLVVHCFRCCSYNFRCLPCT